MGIGNQLGATESSNMSGANLAARVGHRRHYKIALPLLFFVPLSRQAPRVTMMDITGLLVIKEATRKLPKKWHLKSADMGQFTLPKASSEVRRQDVERPRLPQSTYLSSVSASLYALSVRKAISPRSARKMTQPRNVENEKMRCRTKTAVNRRLDCHA